MQAANEGASAELHEVTVTSFDPRDSTRHIQAAIDSGASRVIIPNVGQEWIVRPIVLRSNLELIIEEGVVITAKKGEFRALKGDSVFIAKDEENIVLKGYGATIRMHKDDYTRPPYERGEWRMGIEIRGCRNVEIAGLTIRDTGGDGIYVARGSARLHNENIVIRDVVCDNNHRQGISVITVKGLLIETSVFKNTSGTPPMAGIDFEPNAPDELLQDIVVRNCVFEDNEFAGIIVHQASLKRDSADVSFLFENNLVRGNPHGILLNLYGKTGEQPGGEILIRKCIVEGFTEAGIRVRNKYHDPDSRPTKVQIEDCIVHSVSDDPKANEAQPISLGAESWLESVTFRNVVVTDDKDRPALTGSIGQNPQNDAVMPGMIRNIHGEIHVVNPHGAHISWDEPTSDITLQAIPMKSIVINYSDYIRHRDYRLPSIEVS